MREGTRLEYRPLAEPLDGKDKLLFGCPYRAPNSLEGGQTADTGTVQQNR